MFNILEIPLEKYGTDPIKTGNAVYGILKKNNYHSRFDKDSFRIVVLKSSDLEINACKKMLQLDDGSYKSWVPKVKKKRDCNENILIQLVPGNNKCLDKEELSKLSEDQKNEMKRNLKDLKRKFDSGPIRRDVFFILNQMVEDSLESLKED